MTSDITTENADEQAVAATTSAPAKPPRRRATRASAAPVSAAVTPPDDSPAPTEDPTSPDVAVETQVPETAPRTSTRSRRGTRASSAAADEAAPAAVAAGLETPATDAAAPAAAGTEAPAAPKRRSRRATSAAKAAPPAPVEVDGEETEEQEQAVPVAPSTGALDVMAAFSAPAPTTERRSTGSPRLATTALLFQAPEPDASRPRRRRAQSPAGPPEAISAAAAEHAGEEQVEAPVETTPAEERPAGRGRRRSSRAAAPETLTDEAAEAAEIAAELDAELAEIEVDETTERDETTDEAAPRRRRRRGGRGRRGRTAGEGAETEEEEDEAEPAEGDLPAGEDTEDEAAEGEEGTGSSRRRRRRRRGGRSGEGDAEPTTTSSGRSRSRTGSDEVTALRGSTRLEAKRQRRREGRDAGRRRQIITEAEFLARRESVERAMVVRESDGRTQIAVLEDGVLVEHYVSRQAQVSMAGNVYLGRVQNVLPSMEAAFVDVGKGRNAVLYAGEVNWDAAGLEGQPRRIEQALKSGDSVLVQVTKDPIGHKGARLTSQVTLAGRYLVYVPGGGMTGISRKLPENERARLKKVLREIVPDTAGVIVRTAAEGASEEELRADIARLQGQWEAIEKKSKSASAPALLQGEPDLAIRVVRDIFNDDFSSLVVEGDEAWSTISGYVSELAPDLAERVTKWTGTGDVFAAHRVDEQLAKGMDRKVWLPSGGSLVIDRTEAMTVVDVNTGKFTGTGGTLEETVTRNNLEAAEEIVRQLRLRDIGGIIVIDFIDMVLESNRDLVLRRLVECLGRDRTKHQVAEVTSLGLVQMTRKRVGQGLVEAFSETCEHCQGRGFIVHDEPVERSNRAAEAGGPASAPGGDAEAKRSRRKRGGGKETGVSNGAHAGVPVLPEAREAVKATLATIAAAAAHAHELEHAHGSDVAVLESAEQAPSDGAAVVDLAVSRVTPLVDVEALAAEDEVLELTPVDPDVFGTGPGTDLDADEDVPVLDAEPADVVAGQQPEDDVPVDEDALVEPAGAADDGDDVPADDEAAQG